MGEEALQKLNGDASADLSASQYCLVLINTSGQLAVVGAGLAADGVLQDKPDAAGRAGSYAVGGVTKIRAGAALGDGVLYTGDATGRAVAATTGDFVHGRTRTAAAAADVVIEATFNPMDISA